MSSRHSGWLAILPDLAGGGAQRALINLANELGRGGTSVSLAYLGENQECRYQPDEVVAVLPLGRAGFLGDVLSVRKLLTAIRPQVVVTSTVRTNLIVSLADLLVRGDRTLIIRESNTFSQWLSTIERPAHQRAFKWIARLLYRRVGVVVANSSGAVKDIRRFLWIPPERVRLLPNPADIDRICECAKDGVADPDVLACVGDRPIVLAVGRLSRAKDHAMLLAAFRDVVAGWDAHLVILGEGPLREKLEERVDRLELSGRVHFPGYVHNPFAWMARADVVALSSRWEGSPNVLLEALALGRPVVSTDCPSGPRELLQDGALGRLVPVGDSEAMAAALNAALGSPGDPVPRRARAEEFHVDRVAEQLRRMATSREPGVVMFDAAYPPPVLGGKEQQARVLARELQRQGVQLAVITRAHSGNAPGSDDDGGIPIRRLRESALEPVQLAWRLLRARRWARILHIHTPSRIGCIAALLGRGVGYRVVFKIPNTGLVGSDRGWLWRKALAGAHAVVVLESGSQRDLERLFPATTGRMIPNGVRVDDHPVRIESASTFRILHVARLCRQKRTEDLLHALAQVQTSVAKDVQLEIVGDGPLAGDIQDMVARLGLTHSVSLVGQVNDVASRMRKAQCLVLTSDREGMPNVVLEAMARGLPVIATRVGAVPELLAGHEEWLGESGDIDCLARRILSAMESPGKLATYGRDLWVRAQERYSIDRVACDYGRLYTALSTVS